MNAPAIIARVVRALESLGVPYMLVGSFSSNAYGIPRNTHDADFVVQWGDVAPAALARALGPEFRVDPQMGFEGVTGTRRFVAHVPEADFTVEFFLLTDDAHDQVRFGRRRRESVLGVGAWLPAPEDVIITKLRWCHRGQRRKDLEDVVNILAVSGPTLDWDYLNLWCDRHGTRDLLTKARASVPPL